MPIIYVESLNNMSLLNVDLIVNYFILIITFFSITGLGNFLNGAFNYHKVELTISDHIPIAPLGTFHYALSGGTRTIFALKQQ